MSDFDSKYYRPNEFKGRKEKKEYFLDTPEIDGTSTYMCYQIRLGEWIYGVYHEYLDGHVFESYEDANICAKNIKRHHQWRAPPSGPSSLLSQRELSSNDAVKKRFSVDGDEFELTFGEDNIGLVFWRVCKARSEQSDPENVKEYAVEVVPVWFYPKPVQSQAYWDWD